MYLVFLKIPRPPSSSRLVKNWVSAGFFWLTSQLSLSNLPFQLSKLNCHFRFQPISSWSFFFRLNHPFGFSTRPDFNWLSRPFRFSTQPLFFFEMSRLFRFSTHYSFLFFHFFRSFHHAFENSELIQNRCQIQKDNLVKSIVDFNSSKNKLFSLSIYVWSKWTFKVRNVG